MHIDLRFRLLVSLLIVLAVAGSSCSNSGPAGVYADLEWRVRCNRMGMCIAYPDRQVFGFNGEGGHRISCTVIETPTTRTLSFSVYSASYGISLTNAQFPRSGGTPAGTGCRVTVLEDNTYEGICGGAPPTDAQPCQITNVQFTTDEEGRALVQGNIYCVDMSPRAAPSIDRELTAPGNGPGAGSTPMAFRFFDCVGYTPD